MELLFDPITERLDDINEELRLIQKKSGLTFGTDSYLLAAMAKRYPKGVACDFGSGTGVISLLCASREKYKRICAFELQEEYARLTERNARLNGLDHVITAYNMDIRNISAAVTGCEVDAVLMNPPYMKADSGKGNDACDMNIARRELNGTINDFCAAAGRVLKSGGALYAVYRPDRVIDLTCAMRDAGIEPKKIVFAYQTEHSKPSLVFVEGKKGASSGVTVTRPLIIYKTGTREYTEDMNKIYDCFSMAHITESK